ncbi:MAG: transglycosylase domain-containing protein [Bacteroidaceae bacterium]|nr:transglycosylase domain-containing protein [Prevotellaceae bacterium]MDY5632365.1 transglycosylase domain-containing protein [Bacteroidaceae bacterium]
MRKLFATLLWTLFFSGIVVVSSLFFLIDRGIIGYMPDLGQLENPVDKYASQVFASDGALLGTWSYSRSNRVFVSYNDLPQSLIDALVATEDERFYEHSGIDFRALFRAVFKRGILRQKNAGGGSTITQQLAKQLYSERANSTFERLMQKPIEWVIAVKLEQTYTKEEIINLYLNYFDFLHNAVGIKLAANTYFGKEPKDLTIGESATLVGLLKNPSYYNPKRNLKRSEERRNTVIGQMRKVGFLTDAQADSVMRDTLNIDHYKVQTHTTGQATYFREYLRTVMTAKKPNRSDYASWQTQKFYEDSLAWELDPLYGWCNKNINKKTGRPYNLYEDGLKVYSTIDSRMQAYAEDAVEKYVVNHLQPLFDRERRGTRNRPYGNNVTYDQVYKALTRAQHQSERYITLHNAGYSDKEIDKDFATPREMTVYTPHGEVDTIMSPMDSIKHYKSFLRSGFVCIDNNTGHIKAYVGGTNYANFKYDMASQGRRQVGSTIKPFLYAMAMENGWTPCDVVPNEPRTYHVGGQAWTPRNSSQSRRGEMVTLRWGLAQSNNWVSAYLLNSLSPTLLVKYLRKFGIKNRNIDAVLPLSLGTCDVSVLEMVTAYTAFPRGGTRCAPLFVTRIVDSDGNEVANLSQLQVGKNSNDDLDTREVLTEEAAWRMVDIMQGVMNGGTGSRMRNRYGIHAQMAGKTGTTNDNSDGWFVGYTPSLTFGSWVGGEERQIHFNSMSLGQGANSALPIVALFLQKVYATPSLGYSPEETFPFPANYSACGGDSFDQEDEETDSISRNDKGVVQSVINDLMGL